MTDLTTAQRFNQDGEDRLLLRDPSPRETELLEEFVGDEVP